MLCLCTNTSCKWKKMDLGTLDNLLRFFKRGEDNFSSSYLIHLQKAKEILKEEKSYAFRPFYKIY